MRLFVMLVESLESRPEDADRVGLLAQYLRAVGRDAGAVAGEWLVVGVEPAARPARLTQPTLAAAASALAQADGMPDWLFDAGRAASAEAAEAIALLLPWPDDASPDTRPSLADWLASWRAAAATRDLPERALAIAATIVALDDPMTRRWAVRAVCGLAKPLVDGWQWARAWAQAFDDDARAVAWRWHRLRAWHAAIAPPALPDPLALAALPDAPDAAHALLLAGWQAGVWWAEPRWRGRRVQVVRHGSHVAVWRRGGGLLNDELPAALLDASIWPEASVIEAVLVTRAVEAPPSSARKRTTANAAASHLVLVDWHRWGDDARPAVAARRARLHERWPPPAAFDAPAAWPPVFATPHLPLPDARAASLAREAAAGRSQGWSGLVLRRHAAVDDDVDAPSAWVVRAAEHRVRAVLQYVPSEALGASAASLAALEYVECGFALWNRAPRSPEERQAAMTAAMSGEFIAPPAEAPSEPGLRLLPLARLPLALPADERAQLHAWLRKNAGQRFGAMHAVAPVQVFELGFVEVRASRRHRLGAVIEGARVRAWLREAAPGDAHLANDLRAVDEG